jgi:hypothetical protein
MIKNIENLESRIATLEAQFGDTLNSSKKLVRSEISKKWKMFSQKYATFGMLKAICVNTIDPDCKNQIQFFSPFLNKLDAEIESLPWAKPISAMGGFDDCGLTWIPPAGSMVAIIFENGDRGAPYYLGTIWPGSRGENPGYTNTEYEKIHKGEREKNFFHGPKNQVLPPWNTENINSFDKNSDTTEEEVDKKKKLSYPHIYGLKTPGKGGLKIDDGDYKCHNRWKRLELFSGGGGRILMKDDALHPSGQWGNPDGGCPEGGGEANCVDEEGNPVEKISCNGGTVNKSECANKYCKNKDECRPLKGAMQSSYQNNKYDLPQLGVQIISHAGGTIVFDDSVDEPDAIPKTLDSLKDFSFGCTDKFIGKVYIQSPLGHLIKLNDIEDESQIRGEENGIQIVSASGNIIELNDHTVGENIAGEKRGIRIRSTAMHELVFVDEGNKHSSPTRKAGIYPDYPDGGKPVAQADKAYIQLKSGYGITIELNDSTSQEKTKSQFFRIHCPQKDNQDRGPHQFVMIESPEGPGEIVLRAGGDYVCSTYDAHITIVGDPEKENSAYKYTYVSSDNLENTKNMYFNVADTHVFEANQQILLLAGKDSPSADPDGECSPTIFPVLCLTDRGITISDRVFVSASPDAQCANLYQLTPFHDCKKPEGCS